MRLTVKLEPDEVEHIGDGGRHLTCTIGMPPTAGLGDVTLKPVVGTVLLMLVRTLVWIAAVLLIVPPAPRLAVGVTAAALRRRAPRA